MQTQPSACVELDCTTYAPCGAISLLPRLAVAFLYSDGAVMARLHGRVALAADLIYHLGCAASCRRPPPPVYSLQRVELDPSPNPSPHFNLIQTHTAVAQGGRCRRCSIGSPQSWTAAPRRCRPS